MTSPNDQIASNYIESRKERQNGIKTLFRQVENKWDHNVAGKMDPVERLVYRSNLLGSDSYINNTGGGNTSSKIMETDPVTGSPAEVLWVKGSGGDLRTVKKPGFASLYQEKLLGLMNLYNRLEHKGLKTAAEDSMVDMYRHCSFNLNPAVPSIDTPLHGFIPFKHVDHTHPVACIAVATAHNGKELTQKIYGNEVAWIDWMRPGFELGLKLYDLLNKNQNIKGAILGGHGLINWANDDYVCYETSLELINKSADYLHVQDKGKLAFGGPRYRSLSKEKRYDLITGILPFMRGKVSKQNRMIGTIQDDDLTLQFINSKNAGSLAELGTSCPDHFLRTKIKPLLVDWDPSAQTTADLKLAIETGLEQYRRDYTAYYRKYKTKDSPGMRDPSPTVILIPGLGMIAWGKNKSESRVTAEFYHAAIGVMRGADSAGKYTALPRQEAFDIEYWSLEEAKLKRMPPEKELSRQIIAVIGAGSGIGRALVSKLVNEGAVVASLDLYENSARKTADEIISRIGTGIGVGGSGVSASGDIIGLGCDITSRQAIRKAMKDVIFAYGGLDSVVVTAGLYVVPDQNGEVKDDAWDKSFSVNVKGHYLAASEANRIWREQGLQGRMVLTTSANAVVSKKGSMAYDTSKAAANHLIRELAIELAPLVNVNGVAPATVVEGSSMFPRSRVIASLVKYGIDFKKDDKIRALRNRLAKFYSERTLIKKPITIAQQTEAIFLLLSARLENTTGHIIPVDGGLAEAFFR